MSSGKEKKRVLIVVYYWPPSGGGGVQRWVKFAKYLNEFGWEPIIYAPENADYPVMDRSISGDVDDNLEVITRKIWEPYSIYNKLSGSKDQKAHAGLISDGKKRSWLSSKMLWIRGNWFIPDARKFWIKPSVKFLCNYLSENPADAIISTGPPHSMHLIARNVKRRTGVRWLADFRDPWVHMDNNIEDLMYSDRTLKKHQEMEMSVLKEADRVVTVSYTIVEDYEKQSGRKVDLITNGYDPSDFDFSELEKKDKFIIGHFGTLGKYRNPEVMFKVLGAICAENSDFKNKMVIQLAGTVDGSVLNSIHKEGLDQNLDLQNYLSHSESIKLMMKSSLLLLLLDKNASMKGRMTGKIFEYLATNNPILGLGYTLADPSRVLKKTKAGEIFEYEDYDSIKSFILEKFNQDLTLSPNNTSEIENYSRQNLSEQLASLLSEMVS
ncbi:MAG: glycosyltransferase involved in cell wall biosynthesis [Parvicellaceae bacterium]|jgi:glycosyltransferase involved in cell wall biosynthesis